MDIEFCAQCASEIIAAKKYKAKRAELVGALEIGGITPSIGLVEKSLEIGGTEIHPIIRPRGGDFIYSSDEIDIMKKDIERFAKAGVSGVVFGVLDEKSRIDIARNRALFDAAKSHGIEVSFHRAFDFTDDAIRALDDLLAIGFDRILTSGGAESAAKGIERIISYALRAQGRIQIMAGGGVSANNVRSFMNTPIDAVHFSVGKKIASDFSDHHLGNTYDADDDKIEGILDALEKGGK